MGTIHYHRLNIRFTLKFPGGYLVQQLPDEGWITLWSKCCDNNNTDEDNRLYLYNVKMITLDSRNLDREKKAFNLISVTFYQSHPDCYFAAVKKQLCFLKKKKNFQCLIHIIRRK